MMAGTLLVLYYGLRTGGEAPALTLAFNVTGTSSPPGNRVTALRYILA